MNLASNLGWIGVDVGTHAVKLAQAVRTPMGVMLRRSAVIQRTSAWPDDDTLALSSPAGSVEEIRAALECDEFRGRDAACLLPMNVCELRGLKVPAGEPDERRAMIANELSDDWADRPIPMEFDFWEVAADKAIESPESFNVNVISIAKSWIMRLASDCQASRLDCWAIDGTPLAIARALSFATRLRGDQRALAIDWGYSNTTLCVVTGDRPLYSRRLHRCSFRNCLESIQSQLGVSLDRAQHLADTLGVVGSEPDPVHGNRLVQEAITDAVDETVRQLVDEVQRTLRFFESQRRHLRPNALWLMGGGASMRNIGPHLCRSLEMPVQIWNVPRESDSGALADGSRTALFANALALSALAWSAA